LSARLRSPLPWLAALLAVYLLAPIIAFLVRLGHGAPSAPGLSSALLTSVLTATISAALIALLGVPLAYLLARARGWLAATVSTLVALPLALPPLMSGILLLYLVGPYTFLGKLFNGHLTETRAGIVIAQTFVAAPFLVIAARGAFAAVDPALEDVARTLGHGRVARFLRVALPAAWPGVQAGLLLAWLRSFGEFGATVILAYHPYSLPVFEFVQFDSGGLDSTMLPLAMALGAALVVLTLVAAQARRPRPKATLPAAVPPRGPAAGRLNFALRQRVGDFTLAVEHAASTQRLALLGPSGAGKTLTLRLLAGIGDSEEARVRAGSADLTSLPAERRGVGYLPQQSALLPRRTVWHQVTFAVDADPGLAVWWLEKLGLAGLENRFPDELSGGQQRRVALVRALARNPSLILLDEPFSALDAPVRARLYREVRRLQRELGLCTVLVTHDPDEAALLADEIIVLEAGRALQQGPVSEVYSHPNSPTVAALLGIANTHPGTVVGAGTIRTGDLEVRAPTGGLAPGTEITWAIRPEDVVLEGDGPYPATIVDFVSLGSNRELTLSLSGLDLVARTTRELSVHPGMPCQVGLPPDAINVWAG
jgi:ABC-type sulfate/molybdate transport systems ATPase subunit/ABC-type sulfate transport system permease component